MNVQTLNEKLAAYRAQQRLSLREMAELLRITSGSTINNWEHGDPIPGPASLLLEWLIDGKVPFEESRLRKLPDVVKEAALKVTMDLGAWERLDALRIAGGYATVTDMIGGWIQEELGQAEVDKARGWSESDTPTRGEGAVDEVALLAEGTSKSGDGDGAAEDVLLGAAAKAFADEHPLPPAGVGAAADSAGSPAGRRGTPVRVPRGTSGRKR